MTLSIRRAGEIFRAPKNLLDANWLTIPPRKGKVHSLLDGRNLHTGFVVHAARFWMSGWVGPSWEKGRRTPLLSQGKQYCEWVTNSFQFVCVTIFYLSIYLSVYLYVYHLSVYLISSSPTLLLGRKKFYSTLLDPLAGLRIK